MALGDSYWLLVKIMRPQTVACLLCGMDEKYINGESRFTFSPAFFASDVGIAYSRIMDALRESGIDKAPFYTWMNWIIRERVHRDLPKKPWTKYFKILKNKTSNFLDAEKKGFEKDHPYLAKELGLTVSIQPSQIKVDIPKDNAATQKRITPEEAGRLGAEKKKELHAPAKDVATARATYLWDSNKSLTVDQVTDKVIIYLSEKQVIHPLKKEPYDRTQVRTWVEAVVPIEKKRGGRPKKSDAI